ncbi:MAG: Hsp20/alpha crystallin family protein [Pirellulaceae bacterium]
MRNNTLGPRRGVSLFGREMDSLLSQFANVLDSGSESASLSEFQPMTDIVENEKGFELTLELPGLPADNINVEYHEDVLTISGERKSETESTENKVHRRERRYGKFTRSFRIAGIDGDKISADYADGILKLVAPKLEAVKPRKVEIRTGN